MVSARLPAKSRPFPCQDPRPEAHHRIVAHLFGETCFLSELRRFVAGSPRHALQPQVLQSIAVWRFVPVAESTIEGRHARTSLAWRRHWISPVRVSLSNRLGMLEQSLRSEHISVKDLLESFDIARDLKAAPHILGVEEHPSLRRVALGEIKETSWTLRKLLAAILYQCDLSMVFQPMRGVRPETHCWK